MYSYHVQYLSGTATVAPNIFSWMCGANGQYSDLKGLHECLGHPGVFLCAFCSH